MLLAGLCHEENPRSVEIKFGLSDGSASRLAKVIGGRENVIREWCGLVI